VNFICDGADWLWMQLPSGRFLSYASPRREMVETPWGEEVLSVTATWGSSKPKKGEAWPRRQYHAGIWLENATQGTAADLLRGAIVRADDAGLDVVLHVHDEIVVEGYHESMLGRIMLDSPAWAEGLPLAGEGGMGTRYGK
jgi:DNA polymerase